MARILLIEHDHWAGLVVLAVGMLALLSYRFSWARRRSRCILIASGALRAGATPGFASFLAACQRNLVRHSLPSRLSRRGHGSYSTRRFGTRHAPEPAEASSDRRFQRRCPSYIYRRK